MGAVFIPEHHDILSFKAFTSWIAGLNKLDDDLWTKPISEGKWSVSEIVSHILNWDNHIISQILPAVRKGKNITFPDIETYNQKASQYAKSGITQSALIDEVIRTREHLVAQLLEMPDDLYHAHLNYSLAFLIQEFVLHDDQHKEQIESFVNREERVIK
ncbi:DinB family protein [Paenibacillus sepulcri]|uniref:DinB family protein n=1 Tax=Paenibacillus sepulcri TaxID=359917 RepID=A0ABS7BZ07_9BACL|nr:DinB family protein [Paenibacillus sepulcri]